MLLIEKIKLPHFCRIKKYVLFLYKIWVMRLLVFVFCVCVTGVLSAQHISVALFTALPNDLDARVHHPKTDRNGEVAALIKVVTTQIGFAFEAGTLGTVAVEQKTGEIWVYVPRGSRKITIKHAELGILRDYVYPVAIESACVYEMVLTTGKVTTIVEEKKIESQWLIIKSKPEGANVFIDNELVGTTPFQGQFKEREHTYRLEKSKYHNNAGKINLVGEKKTLEIDLKPKFGNISITSSPENGMQIYLDDENTGKTTPATLEEISSGEHSLKLQNTWYKPQIRKIEIQDEQTANVDFSMQPAYADVSILANPDADILLNGENIGSGNWSGRLLSGIYTVKAEKAKYYSEEKQLEIKAGEDETLSFNLKGKTGSVDIVTTPMEAFVFLDGEKQGLSPLTIKDKFIGNYEIRLEKDGYGTVNKTITIKEDEKIVLSETLPAGKGITIRSNPSGAAISIDGNPAGKTPYTGMLSFGTHSIKLVNGEKVVEENISVSQSGKSTWEFNVQEKSGSFTDSRDGQTYKTVKIGNQVWMAENLNYNAGSGSWCYDENSSNCNKYGRLYDWEAAKKACPAGWHLPSKSEFETLLNNYGSEGSNAYNALIPSGSSGFSVLFGGWRNFSGNFYNIGYYGFFWSSSPFDSNYAWRLYVTSNFKNTNMNSSSRSVGFSVRCLQD